MLPFVGPALAVVLAYLFYTGLYCSDDTRYLIGIQKIVGGEWIDLHSNAERRLVFLLPGALFLWASGGTSIDAAIVSYSLFYVALPFLAWAVVRRHGESRALLASIAVALCPLLYVNSGALLPDIFSSCLVAMQLVLLAKWLRANREGRQPRAWIAVALGALMVFGAAVKESNAVIALIPAGFIGIDLLRRKFARTAWRECFLLVAGALAFLAAEAIAHKIFAGQWHVALLNTAESHNFQSYLDAQGHTPVERFTFLYDSLDPWTTTLFGIALAVAIVLTVATLLRRTRIEAMEWIVPALFFVWPLVYFTIGTASFHEYVPPVMQARYYAPCMFPAVVLIFIALGKREGWRDRVALVAGIAVVAMLAVGVTRQFGERGVAYSSRAQNAIRLVITDMTSKAPGLPIYDVSELGHVDLKRCRLLLLAEAGYRDADASKLDVAHLPPGPFLLYGTDAKTLWTSKAPLNQEVVRRVARGEWRLDFVGYYFADSDADDGTWWLPRQRAIVRKFELDEAAYKEARVPAGYIPWMKREMHSEIFLVTPTGEAQ
ncbi:glycosyltransferase family 39 protein [Lysobacter sp. A6]|uniref:Glycosyltransferase family 39 protein n=1 Tax=Noviluteimonas lactosilytica TaxID=2888523 RepID=A0ABS8JG77_9GAMM|nr:glycosyltransferase family 39 protein [Lysobacter lactosilyticus]